MRVIEPFQTYRQIDARRRVICRRWSTTASEGLASVATRQRPLHYSEVEPSVVIPTVSARIAWAGAGACRLRFSATPQAISAVCHFRRKNSTFHIYGTYKIIMFMKQESISDDGGHSSTPLPEIIRNRRREQVLRFENWFFSV